MRAAPAVDRRKEARKGPLDFGFGGRQVARGASGLPALPGMAAIAERFIFAEPAAAQADDGAAGQAELLAFGVLNIEVTFDA